MRKRAGRAWAVHLIVDRLDRVVEKRRLEDVVVIRQVCLSYKTRTQAMTRTHLPKQPSDMIYFARSLDLNVWRTVVSHQAGLPPPTSTSALMPYHSLRPIQLNERPSIVFYSQAGVRYTTSFFMQQDTSFDLSMLACKTRKARAHRLNATTSIALQ